jgi:CheY-like chemotaxis protein
MIQTEINPEFELLLKPGILQSKTILIAEDDETNYYLICEYLEFSRAEMLWAHDGVEALEMVKENVDIDLILMDIQMPVMNGFEALQAIKHISPNLPIVAITAYAVSGDREKGLKAGFNEYLSKPVSRKILMEHIMRYI